MALNSRDRNIDSSRREDSRRGVVDRCEVINVRPHVEPYANGQGDKNFNTVDVQFIDRPQNADGTYLVLERVRLRCIQHYHGLFQGNPWNPRIGDMVMVYWLSNREGLVMGQVPTAEQEPVCRSEADCDHQEIVCKRAPWRMPIQDARTKSYVIFPPPQHPDCFKWWPKTRDYITVHDCPYGHSRPECDKQAPCTCLDDLQNGTWWKVFSDESPTILDKQRRVKFHHHTGSIKYYDEDGTIREENKVSEDPRGHTHYYPSGTIVRESAPEGAGGVRCTVVAPGDTDFDFAYEAIDFATGAYIRILKSGEIKLHSPTKITLDAPMVECTEDELVDGTCSGPNNVM